MNSRHKGIIYAVGNGSQLQPLTRIMAKVLLPIYDRPMIYYPLTTLMMAGIREFLVITSPRDREAVAALLGNGSQWGLEIKYAVQKSPRGIAEALIIAERFLQGSSCVLIHGDSVSYGPKFASILRRTMTVNAGGTIFAYRVSDGYNHTVVELDRNGCPVTIEEKPKWPRSNLAVMGLYVYDGRSAIIAKQTLPLSSGSLELTALHLDYMRRGELRVQALDLGTAQLATDTHSSLLEASLFLQTLEKRQGLRIACPEEVAFRMGLIGSEALASLADHYGKSEFGGYLRSLPHTQICERAF